MNYFHTAPKRLMGGSYTAYYNELPLKKITKNRRTDAELLAVLKAAATEVQQPFPSTDLDDTVYLPEIRRTSYAMCADILCSALFGTAKGSKRTIIDGKPRQDRAYIETRFKTTNGASIEFRGKELRQDDLTVLLQLISLRAGMATSCEIEFSPYAFLTMIGWSNNNTSVAHLRDCLMRLRQAILIIERGDEKGEVSGFLSEFRWEGRTHWEVQVDRRMVGLLGTAPTYLNILKRKQLSEGLQTWLYGYIRANQCGWAVPLELIHTASGSQAKDMVEFARSVRDVLKKLTAIGVVTDASTVKNGKVAIFKVKVPGKPARPNKFDSAH